MNRNLVQTLSSVLLSVLVWAPFAGADCIDYGGYIHKVGVLERPVDFLLRTVIAGNLAVLPEGGDGIEIADVSNPRSPVILGGIRTPDAEAVAVAGEYVYVAAGSSGLQIIDISNPSVPFLAASLPMPSVAEVVTVHGDYAFIGDEESGLQVVDIGDPLSPSIVGTLPVPGELREVVVRDSLAYVAHSNGLAVVDVSDPSDPNIIGNLTVDNTLSVALSGTVAIVGAWGGLTTIDISNPSEPSILGSTPVSGINVQVTGNFAVAAWGGDVQVVDISNPSSPARVGGMSLLEGAEGVTLLGGLAYVSESEGSFPFSRIEILDITNPLSPSPVGSASFSGSFGTSVVVNGNNLYASSGYIQILDISNPFAPDFLDNRSVLVAGGHLALSGSYLYATDSSMLRIFDVSVSSSPQARGILSRPAEFFSDVDVVGTHAYVTTSDSGLAVIDVANPDSPSLLTHLKTPSYGSAVDVEGSYAYVADQDSGVVIVDVSDPLHPFRVALVALPDSVGFLHDITVSDNKAYVSTLLGMVILDITNPSSPEVLSSTQLPVPGSIRVSDMVAYVTSGSGFQVIDVSNPYLPKILGQAATNTAGGSLAVANGYVYMVTQDQSGTGHLEIFPAQCGIPTPVQVEAFTARPAGDGIVLSWRTPENTGLAGFHVHRSLEGQTFQTQLTSVLLSASTSQFVDRSVAVDQTYSYRLEAVYRDGTSTFFGPVTARVDRVLYRTRLEMSRPNPFGAADTRTTISFELASSGPARLSIFDGAGRRVRVVWAGVLQAGTHTVSWDGRDDWGQWASAGTYFYRLEASDRSEVHSLVWLR